MDFEKKYLIEHVGFYVKALRNFVGDSLSLKVRLKDLTQDESIVSKFSVSLEFIEKEFQVETKIETDNSGKGYYRSFRFNIMALQASGGNEIELADGGDTDWTQKLLNNSKERLLIRRYW